jgi:uncharacterized protein YeaO (DUF488 family)
MIYTSNFSKWKKVPHSISIARQTPKWYQGDTLIVLAPSIELLMDYKNNRCDKADYVRRYIKELQEKHVTKSYLIDLIPDESTLLCWCAVGDFCHRHIIAWVLKNAGIEVKEWKNES